MEVYPGQKFFHEHNPAVKVAEGVKSGWWKLHRLLWLSLLFYVLGVVADCTSSYRTVPMLFETNPYVRTLSLEFSLSHALAYYGVGTVILLVVGCILYFGLRCFNEMIAQLSFAAIFILYGFGSYGAALHNVWLQLGWYVD